MRGVVVVLGPILRVVFIAFDIIIWTVFAWVILSWILFFASQSSFRWRYRGFFNVLTQLNDIFTRMTSPFLRPFRRLLPPHKMGGIDWSPLLLLLFIFILRGVVSYLFTALIVH